jgi:hypothetical protein
MIFNQVTKNQERAMYVYKHECKCILIKKIFFLL